MSAFLTSLLITLIIECLFSLPMFGEIRKKKVILTVIAANLLTNPAAVFLATFGLANAGIDPYRNFGTVVMLYLSLEALVILIEALIYKYYLGVKTGRALLLSGILNMLSIVLGFMILAFGGLVLNVLVPKKTIWETSSVEGIPF